MLGAGLVPSSLPKMATGLAVGLNKGHVVTKRDLAPKASTRKGVSKDLHFLDAKING